jgi:gamma-glutamyltranspeptidase/glutathione hydrolase
VIRRVPLRVTHRGRQIHTNPPPAAGGALLGRMLEAMPERPDTLQLARAMAAPPLVVDRLGSTTHISVLDADGLACSVTCTNGAGSAVVVPGTGIHMNNMMGEADLSPFGFFTHAPGRRLPSMMAPTVVRGADGTVELALGSAGSSRIRSAILQVVSAVIDRGLDVDEAVRAPRVHWEDGLVYAEPGIDAAPLEAEGHTLAWFRGPNVFFGGCQAVRREPATGDLCGAGAVVSVG